MSMTPINSKQITHIDYDDQSAMLTVHYHQGYTQAFNDIPEEQYQSILEATNRYDSLMQLTNTQEGNHSKS